MTYAGKPRFSVVNYFSTIDVEIIAHCGVRKPGDMVKA
jgi:hypothetical protein